MHAELQVLSPLVPVREVNFLRFCKQHAEGVWAVVDVSIDSIRETPGAPPFLSCRRQPSGCVVQDMPNGYSKVTIFTLINLMISPNLYSFHLLKFCQSWYFSPLAFNEFVEVTASLELS